MKYSLWQLEHESIYTVMAYKVKNTNSEKELENWIDKDFNNVASFYREETEINAQYLQTFNNN